MSNDDRKLDLKLGLNSDPMNMNVMRRGGNRGRCVNAEFPSSIPGG